MFSEKARKRKARRHAKQEKGKKLAEKLSDEPFAKKSQAQKQLPKNLIEPVATADRIAEIGKLPKLNQRPSNYDSEMTWCSSIADIEDSWTWGEERRWSDPEWNNEILRELGALRGSTWAEIARLETGEGKRGKKRRKRHHPQEICSVNAEAQTRWKEIGLEQFDTAYRFRLGGTKRVWGVQYRSHFYLVWYERHHLIYPMG